jgi:hypothetical protein
MGLMDNNRSGTATFEEFAHGLQTVDIDLERPDYMRLFKAVDGSKDGSRDGSVTLGELKARLYEATYTHLYVPGDNDASDPADVAGLCFLHMHQDIVDITLQFGFDRTAAAFPGATANCSDKAGAVVAAWGACAWKVTSVVTWQGAVGELLRMLLQGTTVYRSTSPEHLYHIQCSEMFTLRNEKLHTEA